MHRAGESPAFWIKCHGTVVEEEYTESRNAKSRLKSRGNGVMQGSMPCQSQF